MAVDPGVLRLRDPNVDPVDEVTLNTASAVRDAGAHNGIDPAEFAFLTDQVATLSGDDRSELRNHVAEWTRDRDLSLQVALGCLADGCSYSEFVMRMGDTHRALRAIGVDLGFRSDTYGTSSYSAAELPAEKTPTSLI